MATLYSSAYIYNAQTGTYQPKTAKVARQGETVTERVTYTLTAALAANDVINILPIQAGAKILRCAITNPDLDSGTTITFNLGNTASATAFLSASAGFQSATTTSLTDAQVDVTNNVFTGTSDLLKLTVAAGPSTASSGTISFIVTWFVP